MVINDHEIVPKLMPAMMFSHLCAQFPICKQSKLIITKIIGAGKEVGQCK